MLAVEQPQAGVDEDLDLGALACREQMLGALTPDPLQLLPAGPAVPAGRQCTGQVDDRLGALRRSGDGCLVEHVARRGLGPELADDLLRALVACETHHLVPR